MPRHNFQSDAGNDKARNGRASVHQPHQLGDSWKWPVNMNNDRCLCVEPAEVSKVMDNDDMYLYVIFDGFELHEQ